MANRAFGVAVVVATSCLALVMVGGGVAAGLLWAGRTFQRHFDEIDAADALGGVADGAAERAALAQAYLDPAEALKEMDRYSWAVPNVPTPFVGTAPEPGTHANATINAQQLRSGPLLLPKPEGEFRIFLTGGSTAYGSGAPSQDRTIAGYLEKRLARRASGATTFRVYTAANPAWASTHERIFIENRISEMSPDLVVAVSGINDIHWGIRGRDVLWFRTYQDTHFWWLIDALYTTHRLRGLTDVEAISDEPVPPSVVAARFAKNLGISHFVLEQESVPFVFALQPSLFVTGKPLTPHESEAIRRDDQPYFVECYGRLEAVLAGFDRPGFASMSLRSIFDRETRDVFLDDYHFGDRGNRKIAEVLAERIEPFLPGATPR